MSAETKTNLTPLAENEELLGHTYAILQQVDILMFKYANVAARYLLDSDTNLRVVVQSLTTIEQITGNEVVIERVIKLSGQKTPKTEFHRVETYKKTPAGEINDLVILQQLDKDNYESLPSTTLSNSKTKKLPNTLGILNSHINILKKNLGVAAQIRKRRQIVPFPY